jgi:hypothetical protein
MARVGNPAACLDDLEHTISDPVTHCLGCLEFCDRQAYYDTLRPAEKDQIRWLLRRARYLRVELDRLGPDREEKRLVRHFRGSLRTWLDPSKTREERFRHVIEWRRGHGRPNGDVKFDPIEHEQQTYEKEYDPDFDLNAYVIEYRNSEPVNSDKDRPEAERDFKGEFPNHKLSLTWLLNDPRDPSKNLLSRNNVQDSGKTIRYFHFPANNMIVGGVVDILW